MREKLEYSPVYDERPRTYSTPISNEYAGRVMSGKFFDTSAAPEPEPVYTHALLDYDEDGDAINCSCELHTAQSLVEAIAFRKDSSERFQVFELGDSILDVSPA